MTWPERFERAALISATSTPVGAIGAGRDLVPWKETFTALKESGYSGPVTIESFHPDLSIAPKVAVWRDFASSPEALATEGLAFLKKLHDEVYMEKG